MRILFVCLGNICRSPLAEGVFRELVEAEGLSDRFEIASAGTCDYHAGQGPDPRARRVARRHGVRLRGTARQVLARDFAHFDRIIAMDEENYCALMADCPPRHRRKVTMLRAFENRNAPPDVPDPYFGGPDGFERIFRIIRKSCRALLAEVAAR